MSHTICYVDEESREINMFDTAMEGEFKVIPIEVTATYTVESLVDELLSMEFDCLVVDYNLRQKTGNRFMGDEVLKLFNKLVGNFPQVLLTNHDQEAVKVVDGLDIETIRGKYEYSDYPGVFIERIHRMIDLHAKAVENAKKTLEDLSTKLANHEQLTLKEEDAYIQADSFLDNQLSPEAKMIPDSFKKMTISNDDKLSKLIKATEDLMHELRNDQKI